MKRGSTIFLRLALLVMAAGVLLLCVFAVPTLSWEVSDYLDKAYLNYLIPTGLYITALAFFAALWQTWKLLGFVDKNQAFSGLSVGALKNIKYCGLVIGAVYALNLPIVFWVVDKDDAPGLILVGAAFVAVAFAVAVFAAVLERLLAEAIRIKSENDLTV